jgi:molybdate transport system substrate-binding protein
VPFRPLITLAVAALLVLPALSSRAADVQVAVAANFQTAMQKIAPAFGRSTGHKLLVAVGSTGRFHAQVRNGAPFQVLLAADDETPARLEKEGLTVPGTRFTYATGRLVLWSATPGLVDADAAVLRSGSFERLAIADPRLAPYGAAALQVMERQGVLPALRAKLVQGDSVGQAYQFVASGNAALGFVALSQVQEDGRITRGSAWIVPAALHDPLRQDAVLLLPGRDQPAARAFLDFLRGDEARALIRAHGYATAP